MAALTATMSPPRMNDVIPTGQYRHPASRSLSVVGARHLGRRPSADEADPNDPAMLEPLYWDNEDDSFEVPDFHFDWGVTKEKTGTEMGRGMESGLEALRISQTLSARTESVEEHLDPIAKTDTTPPSRYANSAQSSASSAHILSLTDASTASASSLFPTPPNPVPPETAQSSFSRTSGSGGSESGRPGRTYGSRSFQRVVSAPLTHQKNGTREIGATVDDISLSASTSSHTHTATVRPPLTHTSSASSVHFESSNNTTTARNHFVTPGLTERTLTSTTAASTGRRLGGLSRFGGPARRVIPPPETDEAAEEGNSRGSPGRIDPLGQDSDRRVISTPPHRPEASAANEPKGDSRQRRLSPPGQILASHSELDGSQAQLPTSFRNLRTQEASTSAAHRGDFRSISPPVAKDRPFRPFQRRQDQENQPDHVHEPSALRPYDKQSGLRSSVLDRPPPQPLRPAHVLPRRSESPDKVIHTPPATHALIATRPAPPVQQPNTQPEPQTQPLPQQILASSTGFPGTEVAQQASTLPVQPVLPGKRSFLVNGMPYERVGVLGKGGSSKVYSVLCPTKRIVYALKRVALDRADSETYQSYTNEIELLKRLRGHDRIIQLIDHQITFGQGNRPKMLMMIMECGEIDFATILDEQRGKPLNMNFVGLYWEQMLEAVHAVHLENVVHTDLKPANFVLVKGRLKIIDFGIAKAIANDTVNIQRDQQIGTVNYMSPEAIQRMNNQKVLKLSYPSDVWSLGCILYQMVYGNPPFAQIGGGPLPKMNAIADPSYRISYTEITTPKSVAGAGDEILAAVIVDPKAIDSMKRCLTYRKEQRLTIPELLQHEFLRPQAKMSALPPGSTSITRDQMTMLVNFVLRENGLEALAATDTTAEDLFSQLETQNATT